MMQLRHAIRLVFAAALLSPVAATAQTYPSKPIRIIVPFAAGGAVDVVARLVGGKISENTGQPVVIENRPGASGTLGADMVAKSAPDGYTILQNSSGQASAPAMFKSLPFDTVKDFIPVTEVAKTQSVLVAYSKLPVSTLGDVVALAKAKPGTLNYGTTGLGNASHLNMEMLKRATGADMQAVPYKGDAPLNTDLIAGNIQLAIVPIATARPLIDTGQLKPIVVIGASRSPTMPNVQTDVEALPPGFGTAGWQSWFVPANTPRDVVDRIHAEVVKALQAPDVAAGIRKLGNEPSGSTPDAFGQQFRDDVAKFQKVVNEANIPRLN